MEKLASLRDIHSPKQPLNAEELFDKCEASGLFSIKNIDVFIRFMDEMKLKKALHLLVKFRKKNITQVRQLEEQCVIHGEKLKYICKSCQIRLCPDCQVIQHARMCECVTQEEYLEETNQLHGRLFEQATFLEKLVSSYQAEQKTVQKKLSKSRRNVLEEAKKDYIHLMKIAEQAQLQLLEKVSKEELSAHEKMMKIKSQIEDSFRTLQTTNISPITPGDMFEQIMKISQDFKIVSNAEERLTQSIHQLTAAFFRLSYTQVDNDGVFGRTELESFTLRRKLEETSATEPQLTASGDCFENKSTVLGNTRKEWSISTPDISQEVIKVSAAKACSLSSLTFDLARQKQYKLQYSWQKEGLMGWKKI